MNDTSCVT